MRYKPPPEYTRRVIEKYLLMPETNAVGHLLGPKEWRWLEVAYIQQVYLYTHRGGFWSNDCWVTKAEYDQHD